MDNFDFELALQEGELGLFQNADNVEYRLDDWRAGRVRVLFIGGLSGSGKSTTAKKLAEETGARVVSLDGYLKALLRRNGHDADDHAERERVLYEKGVDMILCDNPSGQVVVEGAQIVWLNPKQLMDHAVLIVGTSFAKSTWRAIKRDFEKEHWEQYGTLAPHKFIKFNVLWFKALQKLFRLMQEQEAE